MSFTAMVLRVKARRVLRKLQDADTAIVLLRSDLNHSGSRKLCDLSDVLLHENTKIQQKTIQEIIDLLNEVTFQ